MPAHVQQEVNDHIAQRSAVENSLIPDRRWEKKLGRIFQGDAGEGYTYTDLVGRYGRERIIQKGELKKLYQSYKLEPDFAIRSDQDPDRIAEIVDAKAWYPKGWYRMDVSYLLNGPEVDRVVFISALRKTVNKYATAPDLQLDGKVVLYFPEEILRVAPSVKSEIESWSGSELTRGRTVEVRSMKAGLDDLNRITKSRR